VNSWERMVVALELEMPDKVPLFEMHMSSALSSKILGRTSICYNGPLCLELIRKGYDTHLLNRKIAEEIIEIHIKAELDYIRVPGGYSSRMRVEKIADDLWLINGSRVKYSAESFWHLDLPSLYDPEEVLKWALQEPPEPKDETFEILRYIAREVRGEIFLSFDADGSWGPIVSNPKLLIHVLKWMFTKPYVVRALINHYTRFAIELGKRALDEGADAIMMCVDYGHSKGPWMSPIMFKEFVKPALRKQVEAFKRKGGFTILHSDGNVWELLPDIVDTGLDAYQGIDIEARMDLGKVKEYYGDKVCLIGNVDPRIIEFGDKKSLLKEVNRCLRQGAPGGGYVFSTSANLSICKNAENFIQMLSYVKKRRKYPI